MGYFISVCMCVCLPHQTGNSQSQLAISPRRAGAVYPHQTGGSPRAHILSAPADQGFSQRGLCLLQQTVHSRQQVLCGSCSTCSRTLFTDGDRMRTALFPTPPRGGSELPPSPMSFAHWVRERWDLIRQKITTLGKKNRKGADETCKGLKPPAPLLCTTPVPCSCVSSLPPARSPRIWSSSLHITTKVHSFKKYELCCLLNAGPILDWGYSDEQNKVSACISLLGLP